MLGILLLWTVGCGDKEGGCDASALAAGSAEATIDGGAWADDAVTWSWAGASLQISTEASDGWLMSVAANLDINGDDLETAVAAGEFPIEVDLLDGGFVLLYPDEGGSYASNKASGGTLTITAADDSAVQGCFDFEAATADGETVSVSGGLLNATQ